MSTCKMTIGNGFDLYCSLNTRYKDFFESISQKEIFDALTKLDEQLSSVDNQNFKVFSLDIDERTTFWDILFWKDPSRQSKKNWCDVESFIFNFFYSKNDKEDSDFEKVYSIVRNNIRNKKIELYDCPDRLKLSCFYLIMKNVVTYPKDDFTSMLLDELQRFEKKFGTFVNKEFIEKRDRFSILYRYIIKQCIPKELRIVSLDSFNYTPIEFFNGISYYSRSDIKEELPTRIKHINGDYETPIFGIDSSKFKVSNPAHIFTKTYRRITTDFFEEKNEDNNITLDYKFEDLIIFGHSLNEQDYNYYFPIFDFMNLMDVTANSKLYFLYYIYDEKNRNKIKKENVKSLYSMLNAYEEYKTGKNKDYRLVDTLSSRGRLRFKEIDRPAVISNY